MRSIVLIVHDIRSAHNVGSILRTAEGTGVKELIFTGYTPYPQTSNDDRLPHIARKLDVQIQKTALGAEKSVSWRREQSISKIIDELKTKGYDIVALEQNPRAIQLPDYRAPEKVAIILGREVEGIDDQLLSLADTIVEIPMRGKKESYNVAQATAMVLYQCAFL